MALISEETIVEVKRALDIVEIVSSYIPLKRAGANYKALCPFHEEKTPSFNVNPERQIFVCFGGCGKKGDVIKFIEEYERVDYPEAIRILAGRAGVPVKYKDGAGPTGPGREELYRVNEWAAEVFRGLLRKAPEAEPARQFLARRGVSDETAETWKLGYAMDSWDHLLARARRAGFDEKLLAAAGLAIERESKGGWYDRFRGRVLFPIAGPQGKTIAFGARTLKDDEHPKFINSPETAVFSKGRGFYGLHLAKEELERTRTAYIVEGYLDVVIPHQAGVRGLVATLGTALTRDHLKVLRRHADKVVLVFDSDAAGRKASERGLDLLLSENVDIFVAELPPGMDPDDVVLKQGPDRLRECLEKPREIFDFLMESLAAKHGTETPAAKARIVEEMLERVGQIPDPVKQELLLQQLSRRFGVEERTLRSRLATPIRREAPKAETAAPEAAHIAAARELLGWMLADRAGAARIRKELAVDRWPTEELRKLAAVAYAVLDAGAELTSRALLERIEDRSILDAAVESLALQLDPAEAAPRVQGCLERLSREESRTGRMGRLERLKGADTEEKERDALREVMDARKKRPRDHGLLPGR